MRTRPCVCPLRFGFQKSPGTGLNRFRWGRKAGNLREVARKWEDGHDRRPECRGGLDSQGLGSAQSVSLRCLQIGVRPLLFDDFSPENPRADSLSCPRNYR
ncbi:hypothetical protein TNCV_3181981 [Trichonephila clavipes]|nr:hypothetical protein TNCV_3181981 [Trichonephila clavipes]